jgi:hypothetical protein
MKQKHIWLWVSGMVLFASITRIILYPFNFSPILAMAFFGGCCIQDRKIGFLLPVLAMFFSDLMFEIFKIDTGFWGWAQVGHYALFVLLAWVGHLFRNPGILKTLIGATSCSLLFYFISNSMVWIFDTTYYAKDITGWVDCLIAGLPFLRNGIIADLFYSAVFVGGFQWWMAQMTAKAKA